MSKQDFFREYRAGEIVSGKKIIRLKDITGLAGIVDSMSEGHAVVVESRIMPSEYENARHFLKYGNEALVLPVHGKKPRLQIWEAIHRTAPPFASFTLRSLVGGSYTRFLLDHCIEGMKLYAYSVMNAPIDVEPRFGFSRKTPHTGGAFYVVVPSTEPKKISSRFQISRVPVVPNEEAWNLWTAVSFGCNCGQKSQFTTYRRTERLACHHDIAAYFAIASHCVNTGIKVPLEMLPVLMISKKDIISQNKDSAMVRIETPSWTVPFPMFSEEAARYRSKLQRNVVVKDKGKNRPLGVTERSRLIGDYIKLAGIEKAMYRGGKKAVEFDW